MPMSIRLEVVQVGVKNTTLGLIDIEVPGEHVKALTSASKMIKELKFSKNLFDL